MQVYSVHITLTVLGIQYHQAFDMISVVVVNVECEIVLHIGQVPMLVLIEVKIKTIFTGIFFYYCIDIFSPLLPTH